MDVETRLALTIGRLVINNSRLEEVTENLSARLTEANRQLADCQSKLPNESAEPPLPPSPPEEVEPDNSTDDSYM